MDAVHSGSFLHGSLGSFSPRTQVLCKSLSPSKIICSHRVVHHGLCIYCGQNMADGYGIAFDYMLEGLRFSRDEVAQSKEINSEILFRQKKKLQLVLDLDHTLLHARYFKNLESGDESLMAQVGSLKDVSKGDLFKMDGCLVKFRPYVRCFLEEASRFFDIYICTMGSRSYAKTIAKLLDPKCEYHISSRLITREDLKHRENKSLDLVLGKERGIVVMDDCEKMWSDHRENLILVGKYNYFKDEGNKHKSYSERKTDESEMNGALGNALRVLKRVHGLFFDNPASVASADVRFLLGQIRRQILAGCTLLFTDVRVEELPLVRARAEEMGAACTAIYDSSVTHVVSSRKGTNDCRWAEQQKKYLVHPKWIYAAYYLWSRQPERDYLPL